MNKKLTTKPSEFDCFKSFLGDCVFTTNGDIWRAKRKGLSTYFSVKKVENMIYGFENNANKFLNALKKYENGCEFNVYPIVESFAIDVIYKVALGVEKNSHNVVCEMQKSIEK